MLVGLSSLYNNINVGLGQCTAGLREMLLCFYVMFFMYGHVSGCVSSDTDCNPLCPGVGKFCTNHKYGFSSGTFELFTQKCLNNDVAGQQCECTSSSSSGSCGCYSPKTSNYECYKTTQDCKAACGGTVGRQGICGTPGASGISDYTCGACIAGAQYFDAEHQVCASCSTCDPGKYETSGCSVGLITNNRICDGCTAGYYCDGTSSSRVQCGQGTWSDGWQSACTLCIPGQYAYAEGLTNNLLGECIAQSIATVSNYKVCALCQQSFRGCRGYKIGCLSGYYFNLTTNKCKECLKGTYQSNNWVSTVTHQESWVSADSGLQACQICPPGTYAGGEGQTSCTRCESGKYQDSSGRSTCMNCPPGYATPITGAAACMACQPGYFNDWADQGASNCEPCAIGKYTSGYGSTNCTEAEAGSYVSYIGASHPTACLSTGQTCIEPSSFRRPATYGGCTGAIYSKKDDDTNRYCGYCDAGFYLNQTDKTCKACMAGQEYCEGRGAPKRSCTPYTLDGTHYVLVNCTTSADAQIRPCTTSCPTGQFMDQSVCGPYVNRHCSMCATCDVSDSAYNFMKYVIADCSTFANTSCGYCTETKDWLPGGNCNQCPNGTYLSNSSGKCELCPAGRFCSHRSSSLLGSSSRRLLQTDVGVACVNGTTSGVGASGCVASCPSGQFSPSGLRSDCTSVNGPSVQRRLSYQYGTAAKVVVGLPAPWSGSFLVGRVSSSMAGEILVLNADGTTYSLIGNPFISASVTSVANLNGIRGLAINNTIGRILIVEAKRVLYADLSPGAGGTVEAKVWPPILPPYPDNTDLWAAKAINGYFYVADKGQNVIWRLRVGPNTGGGGGGGEWVPMVSLTQPFGLPFSMDASLVNSDIELAVLDKKGYLSVYKYGVNLPNSGELYLTWNCGGGHSSISTQPTPCNEAELSTAVSVTLASGSITTDNKKHVAYILFQSAIVIIYTTDNLNYYAVFAVDLHSHDTAVNFASWPAGIFVTSGPLEGAGVYELGLHGCLCAAGFYCSGSSGGQCIATPPGKSCFFFFLLCMHWGNF